MKQFHSVPLTETESETETEKVRPSTAVEGAAAQTSRTKRVSAKDKASVIASVAVALRGKNFPSMDVRLKNMVASQVGDLLRGGFLLEDIRHAAVELGLSWDQKRGHNRLCHLAARVRAEFWADEQADHAARMVADVRPDFALPSKSMPETRRNHPNNHPFEWDSSDSCRRCGGPPGVHVRRVMEVS